MQRKKQMTRNVVVVVAVVLLLSCFALFVSPPPPFTPFPLPPSHPIQTYHSGCATLTTLRVRRPVNLETGDVTQSWCIPHSSHNLFEESTVAWNSFCFHRTTLTVTQFSLFLRIFRFLFCFLSSVAYKSSPSWQLISS